MNIIAKKLIVNYIDKFINVSNKGRPNLEPTEHYIDEIFYVLTTGVQWSKARCKHNYSTYHKKFVKYNKKFVFQNVYHIMIKLLRCKNLITDESIKSLYIDSTMIKNIKGVGYLGPNHYDRHRNGNKLTVIVNNMGIPLGMHLSTAEIADVNLIDDVLDDVKIKIAGSKLGGDKGYISSSKKKEIKDKHQIDLITYAKTNSTVKNTDEEKQFLKGRHIVENTISWVKNYKKIINRVHIDALNYDQSCYLAFINIVSNKFKSFTL